MMRERNTTPRPIVGDDQSTYIESASSRYPTTLPHCENISTGRRPARSLHAPSSGAPTNWQSENVESSAAIVNVEALNLSA